MKIKEPRLKRGLIFIGIVCLVLIIVVAILNREQDIEQYYINGKSYDKIDLKDSFNPRKVINNYSDYMAMFADKSEITTLLQNVVDKNFFDTKSLIVLDDNMFSGGTEGHISKVNIENNIANITIKRDYHSTYFNELNFGKNEPKERSYFIPINNKNITEVNIEYEFSFNIWYGIDCVLKISPLIILVITIIKFVKTRRKIKRTITDVIDEEFESKKAIKKLIVGIVASGIWGSLLEELANLIVYKPL